LIPDGVIFTVFVFATAILIGSSFAWMTNRTQNPGAKSLGWAVAAVITVSWMFAAVTIEEFLLVCFPLSVGFGILSSCWFGNIDDEDVGVGKLVCEV
jgi:ABC-type Fe3+ transport system permease subunit